MLRFIEFDLIIPETTLRSNTYGFNEFEEKNIIIIIINNKCPTRLH